MHLLCFNFEILLYSHQENIFDLKMLDLVPKSGIHFMVDDDPCLMVSLSYFKGITHHLVS